jgi:hypothetical protein
LTGRLRCYSFHSVKGGVGKSALSTLTALAWAETGAPTYLVDMDLTGTSLADVLPLVPPKLEHKEDGTLDLLGGAKGLCDEEEGRERVAIRQESLTRPDPIGVPYLNDYLLFATPDWSEERDVHPSSLVWRMAGGPEALHVLPSSALPRDLERILPVVLDEEQGGFLEARLEYLLDALVPDEGEAVVVFDTPPTIPGLSRAVMSLAIRLGRGEGAKGALSEDEEPPPKRLAEAPVWWTSFVVSTPDLQDMRAAARWLGLLKDEEREVVRWLINFAPAGAGSNRDAWLRDVLSVGRPAVQTALAASAGPAGARMITGSEILDEELLRSITWVEQDEAVRIFRDGGTPTSVTRWLDRLENTG